MATASELIPLEIKSLSVSPMEAPRWTKDVPGPFTFISGTGKYAGISGSDKYVGDESEFRTPEEGTYFEHNTIRELQTPVTSG